MKFLFADSIDVINPEYDFLDDRPYPSHKFNRDENYAHEFFPSAPYDGILVSRGIYETRYKVKQRQRFIRDGARKFLKFDKPEHLSKMIMGDCGAFSYVKLPVPPYSVIDMVDFYGEAGFTHGCSVDHIIFEYFSDNRPESDVSEDVKKRYEITLTNAELFLKESKKLKNFVPLGAVQGWSPKSMANSAQKLEEMGYDYIAVGGLVPLNAPQIHEVLTAIKSQVSPNLKIHLLGFAKADQIHEFVKYNITSFDSTSPFIRALKDAKRNYFSQRPEGGLDYYTAIKIPQATVSNELNNASKRGYLHQETLIESEQSALRALRLYDQDATTLDVAMEAIKAYTIISNDIKNKSQAANVAEMNKYLERIYQALKDRKWKSCDCRVCKTASLEVMIFRCSNRNKRRGFHNLWVYYNHLQRILGSA
jgi:hypothetical protein